MELVLSRRRRPKLSYDRDQLNLKSCRSTQTFSTRRHKLKLQLVAVSSIVSQRRHTPALTYVEQRYSQTEREALAIRWACERCYMYLIRSEFIIETDHKPLVPLFNNPNRNPPMRTEHWLMYLQQFKYSLEYKAGSHNAADYLSRHAIHWSAVDEKNSQIREEIVNVIINDTTPKAITLPQIQEATKQVKIMSKLIKLFQSGNKNGCKNVKYLHSFILVFHELSYVNGILLCGDRIVIPHALQQRTFDICHKGHMGIVKT